MFFLLSEIEQLNLVQYMTDEIWRKMLKARFNG